MKQVAMTEDDWGGVIASLVVVTKAMPEMKDMLNSIREDIMLQIGLDTVGLAKEFNL